jgi:putative phage-type endonuclease
MHTIKFKDREDWIKSRKDGLGSSDIAGIMGMSKFSSPLSVWMEKTGRAESDVDNMFTRAGNHLEEPIAKWFAEDTKSHVTMARDWAAGEFVVCPSANAKWCRATPDAFIDLDLAGHGSMVEDTLMSADANVGDGHRVGLLEIKNTSAWKADDWVTGPPPHVYAQVQWQMHCSGCEWAIVAVLIGGNDMRWFPVVKDEEMQEVMRAKASAFWHENVECDVAPEPIGEVDKEYLSQLYPEEEVGGVISLPAEVADWDDEITGAEAEIKRLKSIVATAKAKICGKMGRASEGVLPDGTKYTYKTMKKKGYVREVKPWTGRVLRRIKKK